MAYPFNPHTKKRGNKYGAKKTGGYASKKEYNRAQELALWQKAGLITGLREQVAYELIPAQYIEVGKDTKGRPVRRCAERACSYVADFVYEMEGRTVVEDTKGFRTKEYTIKRKLMLWVHGIQIKEI